LNFVGKFDAKLPVDGPVAHSAMHAHVDGASAHAPSDAIIVPDAQLLFGGEFKRSGVDLVLSDDHHELVLHDYFKGEKRVALASPDGAHLTGDLVNALAGHVEVAQADGAAAAAVVVGHVTKLTGTATAIRNGVSIILNQGENIDKGDVLQSGADSTLGVTFIDGTVFGLSSNARMVVNEMIYDPNGSNNSSLLSLVAGTISFVAGETAKHGDMKVDTPVATMGIRGTAVLVEIDFDVPGQNGAPSANFQVLVEPDGSTGSYILFDKNTLAPLATVNTAGTLTKISQGVVSFEAGSPLTSDQQKLITDLFTTKFGDSNTKSLFDHFTDSIVPQSLQPVYLPGPVTLTPIVLIATNSLGQPSSAPSGPQSGPHHTPGAPHVTIFDQSFGEAPGVTDSHAPHTLSAPITFTDPNSGDRPTVAVDFTSFSYQDAHGHDITTSLSPQEKAAIAAVEGISLQTVPGNTNNGSAVWTYSFPDSAFDFLGAGETLTLTYTASVNDNYVSSPETGTATFTITITGTNDVPVITSSAPQTIAFTGGIHTPGGDLTAHVPTSGTIAFDDPDLTDTHTVAVQLLTTGLPPLPQAIFEKALTASIAADSTGTGLGTINWKLADLPVYLADFIPAGHTITLTYAVTVADSQGATSTQDITVSITGNDAPSVVWIATTTTGSPPGGLWSDGLNWETGTVPTATDDVIIITNQLIGLTPSYPVTIDAVAEANSLRMDNYGTSGPILINHSTLTISGALIMADHGTPDPDPHVTYTAPELDNLGTLTVGGDFDMSADTIVHNSGTISVGGLMEVLDASVLQNSHTLTLEGGGDFGAGSTITNTGTIDLSGGTLTVEAHIANAAGIIDVDGAGNLTLDGGAIDGGTINNSGNIGVSGSGAISNAHLNNGHVTIGSSATLTLDNDTVTGTSFIDTAVGAVIKIDDGTTLTLSGVTINGGAVNDGTAGGTGSIHITGDSTISGASLNNGSVTLGSAKLTLDNDTVTGTSFSESSSGSVISVDASDWLVLAGIDAITGVSGSSIANAGRIEITGTTTLTTDKLINTSAGVLKVDAASQLNLSGATIHGGTITDNGIIHVTGASTIDGNATLDNGTVTVDAVLTLDNVTVSGTTINDHSGIELDGTVKLGGGASIQGTSSAVLGAITNNGTLEVAGLVTLLDDTLTNTGAVVQVDSTDTLTLDGTEIIGGTITDNGIIHVTGASKIDGNATLDNGTVTVDAVLTLDNVTVSGTTIKDNFGIELDGTVKLSGGASIQGASSATLGVITNNGTLEVAGLVTLLNDTLTNTSASDSIIQVDSNDTLALSGTEIIGGIVNDNGTIHVTGDSKIDGGASLNNGSVKIAQGISLTLDDVTVTGTDIEVDGVAVGTIPGNLILQGGTKLIGSQPTIDAGDQVTLNGATIIGGTITDNGTIHVTGASKIDGNAVLDNGTVTVDAVLTLDNVTVSGATIHDNFGIELYDTVTLGGGASIQGTSSLALGAITNNGMLEVTGPATLLDDTLTNTSALIQIDDGQTLTLHGTHITGGIINEGTADGTGSIDVTGDSAISNAHVNHGSVTLSGVTLTLDNDTVSGTSFNDTADGSVIQVVDGTTLTLSGVHITGGAIHDGSADGAGGNIDIAADSTFSGATLNYGHLTIDGGATLTLDDGATISSGTLTIDQSGILDVVHGTAGAAVTLDGSVTNAGLLEATSGGTLQIDGNVSNSGTIEANGGTVVIGADASISGAAAFTTVTITNGGLAHFIGSSTQALDLNATFSGSGISATGTLELDNSQHYGGTISGFVAGDKIDLTDLTYSSSETDVWNSTTHTLTINDGTHSSNIIFSGTYDQNSFALTNDGNGHTELVMSPAQASVGDLDSASNAVEGFAAGATLTDANASAASYQWLAGGVAIPGATASSYAPLPGDLGKVLDVVVGFTDHGTAEQVTALAGTVVAPPSVAINTDGTTVNENASLMLNTLHASFADAGSDSFTVTLDVIHGTLALDCMVGVSESGSGTIASPFILTGTLTDIDNALHSGLVYTPTAGYYGSDTLTFEAHDGAFTANNATATIDVAPLSPVLNSMTLDVVQGGTELLTNADFSVTDPNGSNFLYTVGNVTGGQFEVFNGANWVVAQTGGFTTAQIAAGHVEFVQDGSLTTPHFLITAADTTSNTVSTATAPTVSFAAAPAAALDFDGHSAAAGPVATSHVGNAAGGAADGVTLQGWVDWSGQGDAGSSQLLFYNGSTSDAGFGLNGVVTANGLDLEIQHGGTGGTDMNITLSAGQWYDLALTHVNGVFTLYVDGVDVYSGTQDVGGIPGSFTDNTLVGGNVDANGGVNEGFHGSIAGVGVWNTALTQSQIQANEFVSSPQGNESGLAAYFPLNDGSGTTAHSATNGAGDLPVTGDAPVWQTAAHSIAGGGTLELSSAIASDQAVAFQGSTGSLILDAPANFAGEISGFTGNGTLSGSDQIDLKGINFNSGAFTESYNATTDTLSVSDGNNSAVLHFNGIYQAANFSFTTDNNGGTIVYDPPVTDHPAAKTQAVTATNHGFVFNFADNGHDAANANHPVADTHWFDGQLFANAEAILNKLHDDSHGNAAAPPDSHEALTAASIKAQWHAHDFHFV
jgi:fibronectin-binding autotransporter adhesin